MFLLVRVIFLKNNKKSTSRLELRNQGHNLHLTFEKKFNLNLLLLLLFQFYYCEPE